MDIIKKMYFEQLLEKHALFIISIFFILLIILKMYLSLNFYAPFIFQDEIIYDSLAHNLHEGKLYALDGGSYSPGYPLFLSLAYWIADDKGTIYHIMLAISAIITTSIIFPSYFILRRYCSTVISIIGALTVTTLPFMNFYSFTIMTEVLFIPLFLFSIWFLFKSYETNDKRWEFLASLSVIYLYITRSSGLSMIIAFVLAFVYYVVINKKNDNVINLMKKKSFLIMTFIIFLCSWLVFSTYVKDVNNVIVELGQIGQQIYGPPVSVQPTGIQPSVDQQISGKFGYGSTYNIFFILTQAIKTLMSTDGLLNLIKYFIYLIDYLFLSSYFLIFVVIFFMAMLFLNKKGLEDKHSSIVLVYIISTLLLLIFISISFTIQLTSYEVILGRYIEPVLPAIIIFAIVSIDKINSEIISNWNADLFVFIFIALVFLVLFTYMYDSTIILSFLNFVNNPAIYAYTSFYDTFYGINYGIAMSNPMMSILPAAEIIVFLLLILALIYLSIKDKRFISVLLIVILISSYFFSISIYFNEIFQSKFCKNNNIVKFLDKNTNNDTLLILDTEPYPMYKYEFCVLGFWNRGEITSIIVDDTISISQFENKTTYIVSSRLLPYKEIISDNNNYKLYAL